MDGESEWCGQYHNYEKQLLDNGMTEIQFRITNRVKNEKNEVKYKKL